MNLKFYKKILKMISVLLVFCFAFSFCISAEPFSQRGEHPEDFESDPLKLDCKSAILIEANTRTVLYEKNADEPLPPASVTKIMTLLRGLNSTLYSPMRYMKKTSRLLRQLEKYPFTAFETLEKSMRR